MKHVMALVLSVALVGTSAATTFAQTGTGGGGGGGTGTKSTTTTTSPTTTSPTTSQTTVNKTGKWDCPGNSENSKGKVTANNPNCVKK
jgi:hypothetical protein